MGDGPDPCGASFALVGYVADLSRRVLALPHDAIRSRGQLNRCVLLVHHFCAFAYAEIRVPVEIEELGRTHHYVRVTRDLAMRQHDAAVFFCTGLRGGRYIDHALDEYIALPGCPHVTDLAV